MPEITDELIFYLHENLFGKEVANDKKVFNRHTKMLSSFPCGFPLVEIVNLIETLVCPYEQYIIDSSHYPTYIIRTFIEST